ncbi:DNA topoisomerase 2-binding protein 1-like [Zophobas morio]|uniref:DNA topoisomerase 2-binding protein 1-like n=1 Tax=Zophobas morio TaxID=2755281 RepID=UPI003083338D
MKSCTHLVSNTNFSQKAKMARKYKIPVYNESWLLAFGGSEELYNSYSLPLFSGAKVCTSGLSQMQRKRLEEVITNYSGELVPCSSECTHLVTTGTTGLKFAFALKNNIRVVLPQWIFDSAAASNLLDEADYVVQPTCENLTNEGLQECRFEFPLLHEKLLSSILRDKLTHFYGCFVYFSGFKEKELLMLFRKTLRAGGGVCLPRLNDHVTHVAVGGLNFSDMRYLLSMKEIPIVINANWIIDSSVEKSLLSTTAYALTIQQRSDELFYVSERTSVQPQEERITPSLFQRVLLGTNENT